MLLPPINGLKRFRLSCWFYKSRAPNGASLAGRSTNRAYLTRTVFNRGVQSLNRQRGRMVLTRGQAAERVGNFLSR